MKKKTAVDTDNVRAMMRFGDYTQQVAWRLELTSRMMSALNWVAACGPVRGGELKRIWDVPMCQHTTSALEVRGLIYHDDRGYWHLSEAGQLVVRLIRVSGARQGTDPDPIDVGI